jgi:nucleotide-binding universal stress UspA family protein
LPLDLTSETRQKVGWCIEIAKVYQARIRILSVLWSKNDEIKQQLGIQLKQVKNFIEKSGVSCTAELLETGNSKETIIPVVLEYVNSHLEIDLVVIMTQSEIGIIDFFLDSDAQQIIRSSQVPVMSIVPRDIGMSSIRSF